MFVYAICMLILIYKRNHIHNLKELQCKYFKYYFLIFLIDNIIRKGLVNIAKQWKIDLSQFSLICRIFERDFLKLKKCHSDLEENGM